MKEIQKLLHVKALKATPYHPQADDLVEWFNKTLKSMLRKYATERIGTSSLLYLL